MEPISTRAFDAAGRKIRRVPKGYGENRPFRRRETLMENGSTIGFAPGTERFSLIPRSKTLTVHRPNAAVGLSADTAESESESEHDG